MKITLLLNIFILFSPLLTHAQTPQKDNGYIIYTLGNKDTTLIGHYRLEGHEFTTTVIERRANLTVTKLKGRFFPNGEIQSVEGYTYKPIAEKDSQLVSNSKLYIKGDSTYFEARTGATVSVRQYLGKAMLLSSPFGPYVFMPALLVNYAPKQVGDSIVSNHMIGSPPTRFLLKRLSDKKLLASSRVMGPFTLYLNEKGKLESIDAIGSSYNFKGTVLPYLNMDSTIIANAKRGPINVLKSDSVEATINTTTIKINYTRPSMRGRVIFGQVVPWNRYWRTGANSATKLTISQPIYFEGKELPAGVYAIFTLPSPNGWTMMFNKEAAIWGTNYNPEYDVLRVPIQVEQIKEPVEMMSIEIAPEGKGGIISVLWEKTKASAHFTTRQ